MLTVKQQQALKKTLDDRYQALREQIRQDLLNSDEQHFIDLAGQVHDLQEESVADLLVDLDLAILDLHLNEVHDIEAALLRMTIGNYGHCIDCGDAVVLARLRAYPTAKRCLTCQQNYERNHAGNATPSL
jgi:DnaK suppressor protein